MRLPEALSLWPAALTLLAALLTACAGSAGAGPDDTALSAHSLVSRGDTGRLQRVLDRARRGEPITVGVIGGSITQGAAASRPENTYGAQIARWWREAFPGLSVTFVNAGIGATGSNYGALRAGRDLLSRRPDLVVVEYAVNDPDDRTSAETVEGLVRQVLTQPQRPAVVLLFMMHRNGTNAQAWHSKVGAHYRLPMVSLRDALWPEIEAGRMKWEEVEADLVHPNDRGHALAARFVTDLVESVRREMGEKGRPARIAPLPKPLLGDLFARAALHEADTLRPARCEGWEFDAANRCWKSTRPGSVIEFQVAGDAILAMDYHVRGPMGKVRYQVDDRPPVEDDSWFDQTWGGWRHTQEIARGLGPGVHRVRIELLEAKNAQSAGHEFRLLGLGAAGVTAPKPDAAAVNLVAGTQTFAPAYRFSAESALVETAKAIQAMGSDILKFSMNRDYTKTYPGIAPRAAIRSLRDLAHDEPSFRAVLEMPFRHYLVWTYPFTAGWWTSGLSTEDSRAEYREIYDFARYLLETYSGSGKRFLLGHWEGDWYLHPNYDPSKDPDPKAIQGMIDWLNIRQKAIDDAKRDTPHSGVEVWQYTEVNLVQKALRGGHALTNDVLPHTHVDYVSYSSYDSLGGNSATLRSNLVHALDYIQSRLPAKPEVPGRRVFIGEYGFPTVLVTAEVQARKSAEVIRTALEWGCPYALYWEIYNNEVKDGKQQGFWLIDDRGQKQPAYDLHARFLREMRRWAQGYIDRTGALPEADTFRREALKRLKG